MSHATRGKYAEAKIRDFLKAWAESHANFAYNRITDARSAMGAMSNPQPGDFQWFMSTGELVWGYSKEKGAQHLLTRNGLIESKEVLHEFRLPYKNFGADQVGRMAIRQLAGSECIIIVCHRVQGQRGALWRNVPLDFFRERPGGPYGSWDLTQFEIHESVDSILEAYLS